MKRDAVKQMIRGQWRGLISNQTNSLITEEAPSSDGFANICDIETSLGNMINLKNSGHFLIFHQRMFVYLKKKFF